MTESIERSVVQVASRVWAMSFLRTAISSAQFRPVGIIVSCLCRAPPYLKPHGGICYRCLKALTINDRYGGFKIHGQKYRLTAKLTNARDIARSFVVSFSAELHRPEPGRKRKFAKLLESFTSRAERALAVQRLYYFLSRCHVGQLDAHTCRITRLATMENHR